MTRQNGGWTTPFSLPGLPGKVPNCWAGDLMAGAAKSQQAPVRNDPVPRPTDGMQGRFKLKNADPHRVYQWANKGGDAGSVDDYDSRGYRIERYTPGGVEPCFGALDRKDGQLFESGGLILMSCTAERKAQLDACGPDGDSGQQMVDEVVRRISAPNGLEADVVGGLGVRGSGGTPYISTENHGKLEQGVV